MEKSSKIYIAGHNGMVGSAIHRNLLMKGYSNFVLRTIEELDLTRQSEVEAFFEQERPDFVIDAAGKVGGIMANDTYRAQFIYENLIIQNNIIHSSYKYGVKKLLFLGSSCIYPKDAPQPLREEYLLTGQLEPTNEPYAIAKIAGIKMCESYYRQYGCNFISVMPTNLYGPNDNYNLETSHVLPAIIRKMHLAHCLEMNDWAGIRKDLTKRPIEGINGTAIEDEILNILNKYGITASHHQLTSSPTTNSPAHQLTTSPPSSSSAHQLISSSATITLWGTGNVFREFLHVDDMADACVYLLEELNVGDLVTRHASRVTTSPHHFTTFLNIGTGQDLTIHELAELVKEIVGFNGEIKWDPTKPDGILKKQLDVTRLHEAGWREKIGLREGIAAVYRQYYI